MSKVKKKKKQPYGGRDKLGVWDQQIKTIYKILYIYTPYSTGNYIQYLVITYNKTEYDKEICMYNLTLCCTPESYTTLQSSML